MKKVFIVLISICVPLAAFAWGQSGHRIVGELAQTQLNKKANKKITALLNSSTVAMESNWGDFIKSDDAYAEYSAWHYTNIEGGVTRQQFDSLALLQNRGALVYRVGYLIDELKANPNDTVKLKLLIHLVEDLHCPMHMGRPENRGGNSIKIRWFNKETNLHALWDDALIESQGLSYTEYADYLHRTHAAKPLLFDKKMIVDWAWGTYQITERVYAATDKTVKSYNYIYEFKSVLDESLVRGANHLASVLNDIYGK